MAGDCSSVESRKSCAGRTQSILARPVKLSGSVNSVGCTSLATKVAAATCKIRQRGQSLVVSNFDPGSAAGALQHGMCVTQTADPQLACDHRAHKEAAVTHAPHSQHVSRST